MSYLSVRGDVPSTSPVVVTRRPLRADGVELTADIYLPDGPGPFPVLLSRTPYNKTRRVIRAEKFTRNGYAVAISNVFFPHDDDQSDGS